MSGFILPPLVIWNDALLSGARLLGTGLMAGLLTGLMQWFLLRKPMTLTFRWVISSVVCYPVSLITAYLVILAIVHVSFGVPRIFGDESTFLAFPFLLTLTIAGGLVGFFQVSTNEIRVISLKPNHKILWILSGALSWGMGFLFVNRFLSSGKLLSLATPSFGFFSGFVTCIVLTLFLFEQRRSEKAIHTEA